MKIIFNKYIREKAESQGSTSTVTGWPLGHDHFGKDGSPAAAIHGKQLSMESRCDKMTPCGLLLISSIFVGEFDP
jgi:hypothetical protein